MKAAVPLKIMLVLTLSLSSVSIWAQDKAETKEDSLSLRHAFRKGQAIGNLRYYFMATDNSREYSDFHANALGAMIGYRTAAFHHFKLGVSGSFVYNIGSSDFTKADPGTGQHSRYEIGLFDVTDPSREKDINRVEELYISYSHGPLAIVAGRQLLNTSFLNQQDGRMRPSAFSGILAELTLSNGLGITGGFFTRTSARGTASWYRMGESIGLYPVGVSVDGNPSSYAGHLKSSGVALLAVEEKIGKTSLKLENLFIENILNTTLLEVKAGLPVSNNRELIFAGQAIRQDAMGSGGNKDLEQAYISPGAKAFSFGGRVAMKSKRWETSLNANRITAAGRYLMPREWGRDPFYTFLPRERNEGFADLAALMAKTEYKLPEKGLKMVMAFGYYQLPAADDAVRNKYGMPSYFQLNTELRYAFKKALSGLDVFLLYVYKAAAGNKYENGKYEINKVNMSSWNLILNYRFNTGEN